MDLDHDVLVSSTLLRRCAGTTFKEWSFSLELNQSKLGDKKTVVAIEPEELETHHLFKARSDRSETNANGTPEGRISDGPRGAAFDVFANVFPGRVTKTERVRPNASRNGLASTS